MSRHGDARRSDTTRSIGFEVEIFHDELNKYQLIKSNDLDVLNQKASSKMAEWDALWAKKAEQQRRYRDISDKKIMADQRSEESKKDFEVLGHILKHSTLVDPAILWDSLKNKNDYPVAKNKNHYPVAKPAKPVVVKPKPPYIPPMPRSSSPEFQAKLGFFDKLSRTRRENKESQAQVM
ncbi:hypothetical protein ACFLWY_01760, partial [Chloroflexota bacterium]